MLPHPAPPGFVASRQSRPSREGLWIGVALQPFWNVGLTHFILQQPALHSCLWPFLSCIVLVSRSCIVAYAVIKCVHETGFQCQYRHVSYQFAGVGSDPGRLCSALRFGFNVRCYMGLDSADGWSKQQGGLTTSLYGLSALLPRCLPTVAVGLKQLLLYSVCTNQG